MNKKPFSEEAARKAINVSMMIEGAKPLEKKEDIKEARKILETLRGK